MVFHARNNSVKYPSLLINDKLIERVTQFIFLSLILESNMSWNLHINHISLKTIYPQLVLQTLYNTLILPYINYCILAWGATINEGNPLHLLQNKALRLISNSNYIAHTENQFAKIYGC